MSRLSAPEQIIVRPTNNVYTALVVIAWSCRSSG